MSLLITLDDVKTFAKVRDIDPASIHDRVRETVRQMHEIDDMEWCLRRIIHDHAATPHGPAELVDVFTHKLEIRGAKVLSAFVLKGRSYQTVRPKDVAHQIYRLEKMDGLGFAVFGASGIILDAVKEQFASTCERLGIKYAFLDADDFARLFIAYGFICPRDGRQINGGRCKCGFVPERFGLNVIQTEALKSLKSSHALGDRKGLVVMPTGSGKTRVAALDAKARGAKSILYAAPTYEVLDVAEAEFAAQFGSDAINRNPPTARNAANQVNLCTIQTLYSQREQLTTDPIDYVVVDEFHHAAAPSYKAVLDRLNFDYLLGLTATPFREDLQDISLLCNSNIVCSFDLRSGIDFGILSPYHYYGCFDEVDYSSISSEFEFLTISDLERRVIIPERQKAIIDKWQTHADGKATIAFCCSHKHAERVASAFSARGIPAAPYISETPYEERTALLEALGSGDLRVLCVVDVLNEGADIPFVECLLFLRPTNSKRIFHQQLGRGLRKYPGKRECVVIDFIGNFKNAYRILEYQGLKADDPKRGGSYVGSSIREVLNIPIGCEVTFDDRVLDLFVQQTIEQNITRFNIAQILVARYRRLCQKLGRRANARDVDRNEILDSSYYKLVFRSWERFSKMVEDSYPNDLS